MVGTWSGNQEKSGKAKKNDKSQEKSRNSLKNMRFSKFSLKKFLIFKRLQMAKKIIKNSLKSD